MNLWVNSAMSYLCCCRAHGGLGRFTRNGLEQVVRLWVLQGDERLYAGVMRLDLRYVTRLTSTGFIVYWWDPTCHQTKSIKFGYTQEVGHFEYKSCSILETVVTGTFSDWTGKDFTSKTESKATIAWRGILVRYDRTVCGPTSYLLLSLSLLPPHS